MRLNTVNVARIIVVVGIILTGAGALGYGLFSKSNSTNAAATDTQSVVTTTDQTPTTPNPTPPTPTSSRTTPVSHTTPVPKPTTKTVFKDGTYSATGAYFTPGGNEHIGVMVTLQHDVVTNLKVTPKAVSAQAVAFQGLFMQGVAAQVVGRKISDIQLTNVSGSSLTPAGFNQALATIEAQAKV